MRKAWRKLPAIGRISEEGREEKNRFAEELADELTEEARKIIQQSYEKIANDSA